MSSIVQPVNQETFIDPYSSYLFDMGVEDSRVYLSRNVNSILKSFGEDCVLSGLDVGAVLVTGSNIAQFTIYPGKAIVDTTLHIFRENVSLDLDLSPYDPNGFVVVSISYKYIQTMQNNRPFFKVSYVSADGQQILPNPWSLPRDRLVIAVFRFTKSGNTVTGIYPYYTIIKILDYYYIPRAGFFTTIINNITSLNLIFEAPIKIDGGTFFDDPTQYTVIDFGEY